MAGIPMFIEVPETQAQPEARVCCKINVLLTQRQIAVTGMAGSVEEARKFVEGLKQLNRAPAIYVVNTFGAKPILRDLDKFIGELPVLFLRRRLFAGKSGLMDHISGGGGQVGVVQTMSLLKGTPRLTSIWFYGTKNSDEVAKLAAGALFRFLDDGDFLHIERAGTAIRTA